jgi:hypothetical protein
VIGTVGEKTLDRTKTLDHYTYNCKNNLIFCILKFRYIKLRIQKKNFILIYVKTNKFTKFRSFFNKVLAVAMADNFDM